MDRTLSALYAAARPEQAAILDHLAIVAGVAPETGSRRIPLYRRDGTVHGWAVVSAEDYERVACDRWYLASRGYAARQYRHPDSRSTRIELMHRRILGLERGDGRQADHINRDKLDNRRENLRVLTQTENNQNVAGGRGLSGAHGVHWNKDRGVWMARVTHNGRMHFLGYFAEVERAAEVAARWRAENVPYSVEATAEAV